MSEHVHVFDPVSGWCIRGCIGYREDGRLIHKGGDVLRATLTSTDTDPDAEASES